MADSQSTSPSRPSWKVGSGDRATASRPIPHPEPTLPDSERALPSVRERLGTNLRGVIFVSLAFIGMMGGLLANWLGAPDLIVWIGYAMAYFFGGWDGVIASLRSLRKLIIDIDILMVLAALGALVIGAPFEGAMLLFLFSLSNVLQRYAMGRSRQAIEKLMELRPDEARVLRDGQEITVPLQQVAVGDVVVVRPGDRIPLDGKVRTGESTIDQSSVTGESVPVDKGPGSDVFAGTYNETGSLEIRVTRPAQESTLARLIDLVEKAQSEKAPTQQLLDRIEQPYAMGVLALTALFIAVPVWLLGEAFDPAFYRAMTLMVAASPCALIISTPAAVLSAIASGARRGVLYKGGAYVEAAAAVRAVAFDKTGTLTTGEAVLTNLEMRANTRLNGQLLDECELLSLAAAVQKRSEHHLAHATVRAAREREVAVPEASGFHAQIGRGVNAEVEGATIHIGNPRYYQNDRFRRASVEGLDEGLAALKELEEEGRTAVLVAREVGGDISVLGWMGFADELRPGAAQMIERLRVLGVEHIVMLTGDNEAVARRIAREAGVDAYHAELLPEHKVEVLERMNDEYQHVAMVGDGVNDAPALAVASVGIAMGGAGTDVALETADLVLMADDLDKIPYALGLSRATRRTLHTNFAIAFGAIAIMVVAILWTGLPLPVAVVGHEGSTVLVCLNGLRLLGMQA